MRILVLSDTHGSISKAKEVFEKLDKEKKIDCIIHCGDNLRDAIDLRMATGVRVASVKGNCDDSFDEDEFMILETEFGDILIVHGHMQNVGYSLEKVYTLAEEHNCVCAVFGHTHRNLFTTANGIYIMNPGSLTKPRDGSSGTCGIIETEENYLSGEIYDYMDLISSDKPAKPKPKVTTGHLSSLLNYSDRF